MASGNNSRPKPTPAQIACIAVGAIVGAVIGFVVLDGGAIGGGIMGLCVFAGAVPYKRAIDAAK